MSYEQTSKGLEVLSKARILVVDDSRLMLGLINTCLKAFNVREVVTVETPEDCLLHLSSSVFDAVIIDWRLKESDGLELVRKIRKGLMDPIRRVPIVLCTGYTEYERVLEARSSGIHEMLCKPVTPKELYMKLSSALLSDRPFIISEGYVGPEKRPMVTKAKAIYEGGMGGGGSSESAGDEKPKQIFL